MIVWIASFPRSGNTFLRIVLNRLYGVRSSVVYDVDGVADRVGEGLIGFEQRPAGYEALRASAQIHFIKTHRQRDADIQADDKAICLVRDGRDALVSWARMTSEADPAQFEAHLRAMIEQPALTGTGSWGRNVLSWLTPSAPNRVVLRYDALAADPRTAVGEVMSHVAPGCGVIQGATLPTFAELQTVDDRFFRRGHAGTHRSELPADLHALFWSRPDNVEAMKLLGIADEN